MSEPSSIDGWVPTRRDKVAWWIATQALRWIATEGYSRRIEGAIRYGLASAAQKAQQEPLEGS